MRLHRLAAFASGPGLALLAGALLAWGSAAAETLLAGPKGEPLSLQAAVARARDGDTVDLLPGDYRGQTLLVAQRRLTLRGVGQRPVVHGDGQRSTARALWTVRGGQVRVQNIEFRGARSQEAAGAGLRQEGGDLTVVDCVFSDNEHGILATNDAAAQLTIERSLFSAAPRVEGGLPHLLNVGRIGRLVVRGSRFEDGFEGHMIKSRARESRIEYNLLNDGPGGASSYEIELPAGGQAVVLGNVIAQGPGSQNRVLVAYGSEGQAAWPENSLHLAHNTLVNGLWTPAWFLRVWSDRLPEGTDVVAVNNLLVGPGIFWLGAPGHFLGNRPATLGMLADAATMAFELPPDGFWRGRASDPRQVRGPGGALDLSPQAEFTLPLGTQPLAPGRSSWTPGAFQR